MQLKEYSTAATVDIAAIPTDVFSILAKIVLRVAAQSDGADEAEKNTDLW